MTRRLLPVRLRIGAEADSLPVGLRLGERALAASPNAIIICEHGSSDGVIIYVNPAFERLTLYAAADAIGRNPGFLRGSDVDQPGIVTIREAIRLGREGHAELRNYRKDGSMYWNDLFIVPIRDELGVVTHFMGVQKDITAQKLAETQLAQLGDQHEREFQHLPVAGPHAQQLLQPGQPRVAHAAELDRRFRRVSGRRRGRRVERRSIGVRGPNSSRRSSPGGAGR